VQGWLYIIIKVAGQSTMALSAFIRLVEYGLPGVPQWLSSSCRVQLLPHTAAPQPSIAKQTCLVCVCGVRDIVRQSRYQLRCGVDTTAIVKLRTNHDRIAATDDIITG